MSASPARSLEYESAHNLALPVRRRGRSHRRVDEPESRCWFAVGQQLRRQSVGRSRIGNDRPVQHIREFNAQIEAGPLFDPEGPAYREILLRMPRVAIVRLSWRLKTSVMPVSCWGALTRYRLRRSTIFAWVSTRSACSCRIRGRSPAN